MTDKDILHNLKSQIYHPIYLLAGEEPYFIDLITDYIENNILDEMEKEFNQTILYGKETSVDAIVSSAKRYPMMANYQVIIIKEAQELDKIEDLLAYAENPVKTTILVLAYKYKKFDKRKAFYKKIEKIGVNFESAKLWENKVPAWINEFVGEKGYKISAKSAELLVEFLGADLSRIANELEKLFLNLPPGAEITPEVIEKYIGISKDYNVFELNKALADKNVIKSNKIINHFALNPKDNPIQKVIPIIYSFFLKLLLYQTNAKRVSREELIQIMGSPRFSEYENAARVYSVQKTAMIISYLREYNVKSLGVDSTANTSSGDLLRELVFKILH